MLFDRRQFLGKMAIVGTSLLTSCSKDFQTPQKKETLEDLDFEPPRYSMAFMLVGSQNELDKTKKRFEEMKSLFSKNFKIATKGRASMGVSYPTFYTTENSFVDKGFINPIKSSSYFFSKNPDMFDFLSVYSTFEGRSNIYHKTIKNNIKCIGMRIFDNRKFWGSKKILGMNKMGNICNLVSFNTSLLGADDSSGLLHETGHQWGVYVGDNFSGKGGRLEIKQQGIHFYRGLKSCNENCTPMGSDNWVSDEKGIFKRKNNPKVKKVYHDFLRYFMGILPKSEYGKKFIIYNAGVVGKNFDDKNAVLYRKVSVNDIIEIEGEREISF